MEPDATTLVLLSQELGKPLPYFFPAPFGMTAEDELSEEEQTLLLAFRRLRTDERRQIALTLVEALARF
jgi:hypothetical protein